MVIQFINISLPEVFHKYSKKYNIYRDFYEAGLLGLELREILPFNAELVQKILMGKNEICFKSVNDTDELKNLLVIGTPGSFKELSKDIVSQGNEDLGYRISIVLRNFLEYDQIQFSIGSRNFSLNESYIFGILNVTPDSFSDGGLYLNLDNAVEYALKMFEDGADVVDIGGESTRPGAESISVAEELRRVIPVIEKIMQLKPDSILSIDTTKKDVANEALKRGVKIVNDISAGTFEPEILSIVKNYDASLVLMHMKGTPQTMQKNPNYECVVSEIYDYLYDRLQAAKKAGIKNIFVDPGIGFGKSVRDNYELIKRLDEFKGLGAPIMIGVSRKSFLGKSLGLEVNERDEATLVAETISINNGARLIRTHNVINAVQSKIFLRNIQNPQELILNV